MDDAEAALDALSSNAQDDEEVHRLRQRARFIRQTLDIPDASTLEQRLSSGEPDDESLHDRAALRIAQGRHEEALDLLLRLLSRNRTFRDDAARRDMLAVFEILGAGSPLVGEHRRKLASALF